MFTHEHIDGRFLGGAVEGSFIVHRLNRVGVLTAHRWRIRVGQVGCGGHQFAVSQHIERHFIPVPRPQQANITRPVLDGLQIEHCGARGYGQRDGFFGNITTVVGDGERDGGRIQEEEVGHHARLRLVIPRPAVRSDGAVGIAR